MKAIVVTDEAAGPAGMTLVQRPEPPAAINDVVVEVHASGFVPTEMAWSSTWTDRRGRDRAPSIPGHELAGVKKLLVEGFTTKITCLTGSFRVLDYPSGDDVSTSTLPCLSACLRTRRRTAGTQRPDALYADRGYDHDKCCKQVREAGIKPLIAHRGEQHDSGLDVYR